MKSLELAIQILNVKNNVDNRLKQLKKMDHFVKGEDGEHYDVHTISFQSSYSGTTTIYFNDLGDQELHRLLTSTAIKYLMEKQHTTDMLVGLADKALEKELTKKGDL